MNNNHFKLLPNIETIIHSYRRITSIALICAAVISLGTVAASLYYAQIQRKKIYVLDQGKSLILALQNDVIASRAIEVKDHVTRFHELFFNLAPSSENITYNISRALKLSDKSAYDYYCALAETGYYNQIIQSSISQNIQIDSIKIDINVIPYQATTYAKQYTLRSTSITESSLVTTCELIDVSRSDDNPHGLLIEKFRVIENRQINTKQR